MNYEMLLCKPLGFAEDLMRRVYLLLFLALFCWVTSANAQEPVRRPQHPIIFVPGIFGTKLCRTDAKKTLVWGSLQSFRYFTELRLQDQNDDGRLKTCGELDEFVYFGPIGQDIYNRFFDALSRSGYQRGNNLFVFEYDWRLSCRENAKRLDGFVEKVILEKQLPTDTRFDVLAHSLGGLVATVYANVSDNAVRRIHRLVTVGTPYRGSVKLFESLHSGWGAIAEFYVSMPDVRKTVLSFPSIFELLPRYPNCCALGAPGNAVQFDVLSYEDWSRLPWTKENGLTEEILKPHFDRVRDLDEVLSRPIRVPTTRLNGARILTPEQIYFANGADADPNNAIKQLPKIWAGDGVVLQLSATAGVQPETIPGLIAHDKLMSDPLILRALRTILTELRWPSRIDGEFPTVSASDGRLMTITGVGIEGLDRILRKSQIGNVVVTLKSSALGMTAEKLSKVTLAGEIVSTSGRQVIPLTAAAEPKMGSDDDGAYMSLSFRGQFVAPPSAGQATFNILFASGAMNFWNFGVVE